MLQLARDWERDATALPRPNLMPRVNGKGHTFARDMCTKEKNSQQRFDLKPIISGAKIEKASVKFPVVPFSRGSHFLDIPFK